MRTRARTRARKAKKVDLKAGKKLFARVCVRAHVHAREKLKFTPRLAASRLVYKIYSTARRFAPRL